MSFAGQFYFFRLPLNNFAQVAQSEIVDMLFSIEEKILIASRIES